MLKNRKKLLALVLGMSMFLTFPTYAANQGNDRPSKLEFNILPAQMDTEKQTEVIKESETESDIPQTEEESESEIQPGKETETPDTEPESEDDIPIQKMDDKDIIQIEEDPGEGGPDEETKEPGFIEEPDEDTEKLVVTPEEIPESFRFETVVKDYAVTKKKLTIFTAKDTSAEPAGKIERNGLCYILLTEGEWCYVESGEVRGFVKKSRLTTGVDARKYVFQTKLANMKMAKPLLKPYENPAFTYTKTTVQETVVKRVYAIARDNDLNIREEKSTDARIVGVLPKGALCCILADGDAEWCYVESGDVRGFMKKELLITGKEAKAVVKETGRKKMTLAEEKIAPEDNQALYYTITSTEKAYGKRGKYLGKFKLTAYCACSICCGSYANGITASGTTPVQGRTVAMYGVPFGTKLIVDGAVYTVEDRGTPYGHIDIYMVSHGAAAAFGVREADVYLAK